MSFQLVGGYHQHAFRRDAGNDDDGDVPIMEITLSLIVPVKDEEEAIRPFLARTMLDVPPVF